jgi:hypothetical protein
VIIKKQNKQNDKSLVIIESQDLKEIDKKTLSLKMIEVEVEEIKKETN